MVFQKEGDGFKLGLWKIEEEIAFFESSLSYRSLATHPRRVKQQLAARMALQSIHGDFPFEQVELLDSGKPVLKNGSLKFSLSHCNAYAAAILSNEKEVGIDIEPINDRILKVEKKFLNEHEFTLLESVSCIQRSIYVTLFWSLKESMFKWWGKRGVDFSSEIQIVAFEDNTEGMAKIRFTKLPKLMFHLKYFQYEQVWISLLCQ